MTYIPIIHTNPAFSEMIVELDELVAKMFDLTEEALSLTLEACRHHDIEKAKVVIANDKLINETDIKIIEHIGTILARHQPVAHDLHALMGTIKLSQELERMCDHAKNICRRLPYIYSTEENIFEDNLIKLGETTLAMLTEFISAEKKQDYRRAESVYKLDEDVNKAYRKIVNRALAGEGKDDSKTLINTLFIAKDYERIGDRIKNLSEVVHYQLTGENIDFEDEIAKDQQND